MATQKRKSTSGIAWCEETWNPVRGCSRVSAGCMNCYAETMASRFSGPGQPYEGLAKDGRWTGVVRLVPEKLDQPRRWQRPRLIFVNSMSDLFHDALTDEDIARVWQMMGAASQHTYQVLTKRHARMLAWTRRWYAGEILEPFDERPVPGYPGYRVTTLGTVLGKRCDTVAGLSVDEGDQGHLRVTMHRNGAPKGGDRELVHRVVLSAFVRPPRPGEQACHRNGDPSDNRLSNLYWGSQSQNWEDRARHGSARSWSKLTDEQVATIRDADRSMTSAALAREYGVSDTLIRGIRNGERWKPKHIPADRRVPAPGRAVLNNCWLGVSVEDQATADERIPILLDTPAATRWVSYEPALGPVDFTRLIWAYEPGTHVVASGVRMSATRDHGLARVVDGLRGYCNNGADTRIDWIVAGGESGRGARPDDPAWYRAVRDQCAEAGVAFFMKQLGGPGRKAVKDMDQFPEDLRIRQYPEPTP